jgi:predicted RND superfamily exporter protein
MSVWGEIVVRHKKAILVVGAIVFVAGMAGIPMIQRKADFAFFFPPANPVRLTEGLLQNDFGGSRPLQIHFAGDMENPFVLKEMLRLERFLEGEGLARNPISVADLIAEMNDIMENRKTIPNDQAKVANLMFLLEGQDIVARLLSDDKKEAQVQAMTGLLGVRELQRTVDSLDGYIRNLDTTLMVVSLDGLPAQDQAIVFTYRAERVIESLRWLARTRRPELVLDETLLLGKLEEWHRAAGSTGGSAQALSGMLPLFPGELKADKSFLQDLSSELDELSHTTAAVPERVYVRLSTAAGPPPKTVEFKVGWTGMPLISWHLDQSIIKSQAESLGIALVFIFLLLAIRLRSWIGGLIGLVPILLAIVLMFGVMGFAGIPINVATVLVGAIALGIGIDYVIHFSIRFTTYYRGPGTAAEAVKKTMQTTGRAIIINVMAVTMGFITLIFAHLLPLQQFGILTAIAMLGSGLGALTLLPALILLAPSAFMGRRVRAGNSRGNVEPGKEIIT